MLAKGQAVIQMMEQFAPKRLAVPEDRIGLQVGTLNKEIEKVLVSLDVTEQVVEEAIALGANLIIAHHAVIFRPLKHMQTDTPAGRIIEKCIKHDIAVYISHTNLDIANGGVNDLMAAALDLVDCSVLEVTYEEALYKFVTFVPAANRQQVSDRIFAAGAGAIGDYSHCSFNSDGIGTFYPQAGTNPYIGQVGKLEEVEEIRIETIVPESHLKKVVQALRQAHPYEEPAYDIYPLKLSGEAYGLGRIGKLSAPMQLAELTELVKDRLQASHARVVGEMTKTVRKVAVLGGSGSRYIHRAHMSGADVLVTGDIDFHTAQDALALGLAIIDPGHHTEKIIVPQIVQMLSSQLAGRYNTTVIASQVNTDPFQIK